MNEAKFHESEIKDPLGWDAKFDKSQIKSSINFWRSELLAMMGEPNHQHIPYKEQQ